ncbi:GNAT family N-acetyltransferase [Occultella glacieicola]|uniref:GNAT family N-acetyltransferase n=1 Tax=Occultella glacieicola TaxID=2518684 RepID=UPI001A9F48CC|nr:GNAT family N-acetyltransferase [Occultella glacieicola]
MLEIHGLAVHPAETGRGIGTALVEAAVAELGRRGARKVSLRVLSTNPAARRLYARCGFVEEGVLRGEFVLESAEVDDILMARYLTP